ncbi:MAG: hypothetical protein ACJ0RD_03920 [Alphaproteobacteria bacterium]
MNFLIDDAPALVVVLPLIVSAIIAFMPSSRWPWIISIITLVVHLFISFELLSMVQTSGVNLYEFGNWQPPWGIAF